MNLLCLLLHCAENTSCPVHAALLQKGLPVVLEDRHSEKEQQMKALKDLQELIVTLDGPPSKFCIRVHSKVLLVASLELCFLSHDSHQ